MQEKSIPKTFLKYVSLNVAGMIGLSCYILADTYFVSKGMGTRGLAALNLAISVYSLISGLGLMIGIGGATRYAVLKAQKADAQADRVFSHSVMMGLLAGVLFVALGIFGTERVSLLLGANEDILGLTVVYMRTLLCFGPVFILNNILLAFVRNDGEPGLAMLGMLAGSFSNIILDYIFIFVFEWGMFGAAFATGFAPCISIMVMSGYFIHKRNKFHFRWDGVRWPLFGIIASLGTSALTTELSNGVVLVVFNLVIMRLKGTVGVAAYGIVANLSLVAVSIFTGISQGIQPLVSDGYGRGDTGQLKVIFRYAAVLSVTAAGVIYGLVFGFTEPLAGIFNHEKSAALKALAEPGLRIYFTGFFFAGINIVAAASFSAVEKPKQGFAISILRGVAAIVPLVLILSALFGITGVWASFPCAEGASAVAVCVFCRAAMKNGDAHRRV